MGRLNKIDKIKLNFIKKMDNCKIKLFINKLKIYEPTLVSNIYDLTKNNIKINKHYIITKNINGEEKKQCVRIDDFYLFKLKNGLNEKMYSYEYGIYGFHEGFCLYEQIKDLTYEEKDNLKNGKFWNLPQQFLPNKFI